MYDVIGAADFRRQIKSQNAAPGYLFFGDEDYLKQDALSAARSAVITDPSAEAFDYISIDRASFSAEALAEALAPPPMLSEKKLVVAEVTFDDLKKQELEDLCTLLGNSETDGADNVLIINVPAGSIDAGTPKRPSALLKKLSDCLVPVRFDRATPAKLAAWVGKHYASRGVGASPAICAGTVEHCGTDMFRLSTEIDKIAFYTLASGRKEVTAADVREAGCSAEEYDAFALGNAVISGKYGEALEVLARMKAQKLEPVYIMSELIRVICDLNAVNSCVNAGMNPTDISAVTGIKPYPLSKYLGALRGVDEKALRRALDACAEADRGVKGYTQDYISIERLICSL